MPPTPPFHSAIRALAVCLLLSAPMPALAQALDRGMVVHYPFEDNLDEGMGSRIAPVVRGRLAYADGALGRALLLSDGDELDFGAVPSSTFAGDFTIAWFMNLERGGTTRLFGKEPVCSVRSDHFTTSVASGTPARLDFRLATSGEAAVASAVVPRGSWVHVALVRSGDQAVVYVDGRPGQAQLLPKLALESITAPFGLANSPCIDADVRAPVHPQGRFDDLRVYPSAVDAALIAQMARRPSLAVAPQAVTAGGRLDVRAAHLVEDRSYRVQISDGVRNIALFDGVATGRDMRWNFEVPELPPGDYALQLVSELPHGVRTTEGSSNLWISAPLSISADGPLQAGKRAEFTVGNVPPGGMLRLLYAGRAVAGPVAASLESHRFALTLPHDISSTVSGIAVRAEVLAGQLVSHVGQASFQVAAPFTGPFATVGRMDVDDASPRLDQAVTLTGSLNLADGASMADTDISAWWVGDDGKVTPLPTSALATFPDGSFRLDTRPPSIGAMTAVPAGGGGRIRLTMQRHTATGRTEWTVQEGPQLTPARDFDADTDITVHVRRRIPGGTEPLPGAYVVLSSAAPLGYTFDLPGGNGGTAGDPVGGGSVYQQHPPRLSMSTEATKGFSTGAGPDVAVNQINSNINSMPPPPPPSCGEDLYRRYTDADGRAEFPVLGAPEEEADSWQLLQFMQMEAVDCGPSGCLTAQVSQVFEFELAVYTLHLGAGYRHQTSNAEVPTRFRIRYERDTETFNIKNLRTGEESVQAVSANLDVEVPQIAMGNFVTLSPPLMYHEVGGVPAYLVSKQTGGFGKWIDFSNSGVAEFVNASPRKVIQFGHRPDVNGSLTSAQLFLRGLNGRDSVIGEFQQVTFADGCNVQDDPSGNRPETWRLVLREEFDHSWRFPQGVFFPVGGERKACGYIRAENARGGVGRHNLCFYWQAPPPFVVSGSGIVVNDANMLDVQVEEAGASLGGSATTVPKRDTDFLGEPVDKPGRIDNQTDARSGAYASVGPNGPVGGSRQVSGNNPRQFSEAASGDRELTGVGQAEAVIQIGDDEYQTILDTTIPLFQWYWGIPEILSAEVYAKLRLLASYYFGGTLTIDDEGERLDMLANAVFAAVVTIGVDIDVLFGIIVDAGATLSGLILSEMPVEIVDGQSQGLEPCFLFQLRFDYYVDPCPLCPTPVISDGADILKERAPEGCTLYSAGKGAGTRGAHPELAGLARASAKAVEFDYSQSRMLRRHATLAFDDQGSGQFAMLNDANQLVVSDMSGASVSPAVILSNAPGVRDPQIAYYDDDRAVAVWSESALPESEFVIINDYVLLARNQRLAWSQWDGEQWSDRQFLTEPGPGEGQIALTACMAGADGCPADGEVLATWQRDANADAEDPNYRLWFARFQPGDGFSAAAPIDPSNPGNVQDITPATAYVAGRPVVVWTRQFGPTLSNFSQRNLAYRVLPDGLPRVVAGAPGATAPAASSAGGSALRVAWLRADLPGSGNPDAVSAGAVGTHNALHVAGASCTATQCSFPQVLIPPTRDQHGRRIYGERPRLLRGGDDVLLVMRMFSFGGDGPVQDGDPIGTVINSADMVLVAPNYATGIARVTPLSADGATHMGVFAAYNPASRSVVSGSSTYLPPFAAPLRAALKATGFKGHRAYGKALASVGPVELVATVAAPDLAVEAVEHGTSLLPASAQQTAVIVGNRGTAYRAEPGQVARLELRWNSRGGPVLASADVPAIPSGGDTVVDLAWTAPAEAHPDEAHALHAVLVVPGDLLEITDDNNALQHEVPGLPVPTQLAFSARPGLPQVQLGWEPTSDSRVAGYRVYRQEQDGSWLPLGASPTHGFLDLSAAFFVPRTYAVTSYSERGVESALSASVVAMPVTIIENGIFRDGFEPTE